MRCQRHLPPDNFLGRPLAGVAARLRQPIINHYLTAIYRTSTKTAERLSETAQRARAHMHLHTHRIRPSKDKAEGCRFSTENEAHPPGTQSR